MSSNDPESYENDLATNRFQNLMLVNGLWLLAYFEGKSSSGKEPVLVFGNVELVGTILPCLGLISTALSTSALWLGLRYLNAHFGKSKSSSCLLRMTARGHYHIVPILVIGFWLCTVQYKSPGWIWVAVSAVLSVIYLLGSLFTPLPKKENS